MKKLIVFFTPILIFLLLSSCNSEPEGTFKVSGNLEYPVTTSLKLLYMGVDKATSVDSATLSDQKQFTLSGQLSHPGLFVLHVGHTEDIYLVIYPDDKIILEINNSKNGLSYTVEGSTDSRLVNEIMTQNKRVRRTITQISLEYEKSKQNPETFLKEKIRLDSTYDNLLNEHKKFSEDFIYQNSKSLAAIFALYQNFGQKNSQPLFDSYDDMSVYNYIDSALSPLYPETEAVIALNRDITQLKEQLRQKKHAEKIIAPGKRFPDFELFDISGESISLTNYNGESVIFIFFAAWNDESVNQLIKLNELISKYPYRRQNIIGISFDTSKEKLENLIGSNDINFPVICDYKYWDSPLALQFGVRAIPDILLINKNHITHQRNLSVEELKQILSEWN